MVSVDIPTRYRAAISAGFNVGEALVMTALSLKECPLASCGSTTSSGTNNDGTFDFGIFQINSSHFGGNPSFSRWGDLADPINNARAAFSLYQSGGFNQWCTYPTGCNNAPSANKYTFATLESAIQDVVLPALQGANAFNPDNPPPGGGGSGGGGSGGGGGGSSGGGSGGSSSGGGGGSSGSSPSPGAPFGAGAIDELISGPLVIVAGVLFLIVGIIAWKGPAINKNVIKPAIKGTAAGKAAAVALG